MTREELRLECLRMAGGNHREADLHFDFVMGRAAPVMNQETACEQAAAKRAVAEADSGDPE